MSKKLYYAKVVVDVVFEAEEPSSSYSGFLESKAKKFLNEEIINSSSSLYGCNNIKELSSIDDVPKEWKDTYYYGGEGEYTVREYFLKMYK